MALTGTSRHGLLAVIALSAVIAALIIVFGMAAPSQAAVAPASSGSAVAQDGVSPKAVVYVGGGKWNYGVGVRYVWSYYQHNAYCHKASAHGRYWSYSGKTRPGVEARASAQRSFSRTNESYWDNRCG